MADFDTPAKRYSGLCLGDMLPVTPIPDGAISVPDRLHFLDLYSGIAAGAPVVVLGDDSASSFAISAFGESSFQRSSMPSSSWGGSFFARAARSLLGGFDGLLRPVPPQAVCRVA